MSQPTPSRINELVIVVIAVVGGIVAATAGARPTGSSGIDIALVALAAGAVVWASATAPWWALAAAAAIGTAIAFDPLAVVLGVAAFAIAVWIGLRARDLPELSAVAGALAVNALIRSDLGEMFGLSAIIGIATCIALFVIGVWQRPPIVRYGAAVGAVVVGAFAVIAVAAAGLVGWTARNDIRSANRQARDGIAALNDGDYTAAADHFEQSSATFDRVDARLGAPWMAPALLIPGVSQNLSAGADLAAAADTTMAQAGAALRQIDPSSFEVTEATIDLDEVRAAEAPLVDLQRSLLELRAVADGLDSPWLIGRLREELDELDSEFVDNEPRVQNAIDVVRVAPAMLGGDGERRYLVLFTTPAEARGLGGFVGNYAVITADDGKIRVGEFGRRGDLEDILTAAEETCTTCAADLLAAWGDYGLTAGPRGTIAGRVWKNLAMSANFPYVAESAVELYTKSDGKPVDGVLVMDPYVVEAMMAYTGPVEVPQFGVTIEPDEAVEFILRDQYALAAGDDEGSIDSELRVDALAALGKEVIDRLLTSTIPSPADLVDDLGPLVDERRLLMWTTDPDEQAVLEANNLLGGFPALDPVDGGFSVSFNNTAPNKVDSWLERTVDLRVEPSPAGVGTGRQLVADVAITNGAPTTGYPDYVLSNYLGLPRGSSRLLVTFHGPPTLREVTVDGEPFEVRQHQEAGWTTHQGFVKLESGESATFRVVYELPADGPIGDDASPSQWDQPMSARDS